jgi:hypothetical protein
MSEDKPKIIIDEDWKSQVQAEKQTAEQPAAATPAESADDPLMPPASFELLLSSLATEAMMALGQLPNPYTGKPEVRRNQAKYLIDMIDVLKEKTKGNLKPGDELAIEDLLHQLRMAFVATA